MSEIRALDVLRRAAARTPVLKRGLAYTIVLAMAAAAGRLAVPALIQQTIDRGLRGPGGYRLAFVVVACLVALAIVTGTGILAAWAGRRMVRATQESLFELRVQAFRRVHDLSRAEHSRERQGELLTRVTSDIESAAGFVQWGAIAWTVNLALLIGAVLAMFAYSWQLALIALVSLSPMFAILRRLHRRQLAGYDQLRTRTADTSAIFSELLRGRAMITAYGYHSRVRRRVRAAIDEQAEAEAKTARYSALMFTAGDIFGAIAFALVVGAAVVWGSAWGLRLGQVVAFIFLVNLVLLPVGEITELLNDTQMAVAGWNKVLKLLDRPVAVPEPEQGYSLSAGPLAVSALRVTYAYDGQPPAIADVDLDVPAGARIAIVGETGAGKSTFAALLCRFADPTSGIVEVDGHDLREVEPASRRSRIALIPQDGFLFDTTVRENVLYGRPDAEPGEVEAAFADLGLDWWIDQLPDGLQTSVGIRGANLSVGERQLVALARAQLANSGLLILDEATSAVDGRIERALADALARLAPHRTTISIAHRLTTAEAADQIVVFHAGRLVERGSHQELATADGMYARLHRSWLGTHTSSSDDRPVAMGNAFDLSSYRFAKDPHPTYGLLRETCPVHRDQDTGSWYVSRFDDVRDLLVDEGLRCQHIRRSTSDLPESQRRQTKEIDDFLATWPIFNHTAGHAVIRKALLASLGPAPIRALEPRLVRWTSDVAARVAASQDGDIVVDFARPAALYCLAALLDAPLETVRTLRTMSDRILDYLLLRGEDADTTARAHEAMTRLTAFADDALASDGGGLVTGPLARLGQQGLIEHSALVGTIAEFVQGTVEPLTTTVCVAVHGVASDPGLRAGLRSGAIAIEAVVEEALRFDPPFHLVQRVPDRPVDLDGRSIDAGSEVFLVIAAANRDGTRWTDAERFDPTRARRPHITFGLGPHACPGGPLVRLQASAALRAAQEHDLFGRFAAQKLGRLPIVDETRFTRVR